jgi:tetratricopeptide (TPR) repeat protein
MDCSACDQPNRPGARLCKTCQAPLPASCTSCGATLESWAAPELCVPCRADRLAMGLAERMPSVDPNATLLEAAEVTAVTNATFELAPALIGREEELARLAGIVDEAVAQHACMFVTVVGQAGVGKTRLIRELLRTAAARHADLRVLAGSAAGPGHLPHGAIVRALTTRFGITPGTAPEAAQEKITAGVAAVLPAAKVHEVSHLLAHLLHVGFTASPVVGPLLDSPQQLEMRTFMAIKKLLAAEAEHGPLILFIDDLDRAGSELANLFHYLAAGLATAPVVLIAAARPLLAQVHPSFGLGDRPTTMLQLTPLGPQASEALMREACQQLGDASAPLAAHASKLGGTPRAILELPSMLLDAGVIHRDHAEGKWLLDQSALARTPLPRDHAGILARRLEHVSAAERSLLEKAAVVGEIFWLDALVALARIETLGTGDPGQGSLDGGSTDRTRQQAAHLLDKLGERGWIAAQESSIPGEREYRFAYPPLLQVIYDRQDEDARRRSHLLVAQWLELRPEGRGEEAQEDIGRHLERSGAGESAAARYRRAGDAARTRYQNGKAIRLYAHALDCVGDGDLAARIHLWHDLGSVYELKGDFEAALSAFETMLRLSWLTAARTKAAVAFNKIGRVYRRKGDLKAAHEHLQRGKELFEQSGDQRGFAGSLDDLGQVAQLEGRYDDAFAHFTRALNLRGRVGDQRSIAHSLSNLGILQKNRGRFPEAENCHREALQLRRAAGDRPGAVLSLNNLGVLAYHRGVHDDARRIWEQALSEAEDIGAKPLMALVLANLGELALTLKKPDEARRRLGEAMALARELEDRRLLSEATRNLSLLELEIGDAERARELAAEAHELAESSGLRDYVGRALLALGQVHGATIFDDVESTGEHLLSSTGAGRRPSGETPRSAEAFFEQGIDLFRQVGNDSELAWGLERYGRFKLERGEVPQGRALLEEAAALFAKLGMKAGDDVRRVISELG